MPVSRTATVTASDRRRAGSRARAAARPRPASVNLTAFDSRLSTIWRSRPSSPTIARGRSVGRSRRRARCRFAAAVGARTSSAPSMHGARSNGCALEVDLAGLDLREVEDVVDDRQQRVARRPDRVGVVALLVIERRVEQQAAHADDRVHRRPDLVAHRREERALGLVGVLGRLAGGLARRGTGGRSRGDRGLLREPDQQVEVARA